MYSNEMESLIQAVLEDGVLTEQEKRVLVNRAQKEGIDIDELEVYIQSLLQKRNQAGVDKEIEQERSHKHGILQKCPNCGAAVESGIAKCISCGYEFRGLNANKSSERLSKMLNDVKGEDSFERLGKQATIVSSFPIPTTKEDLLEFLISMTSKEKVTGYFQPERSLKEAYRAKMDECIMKARISFPNDPVMQQVVAEAQAALDVPLKNITKVILTYIAIGFGIMFVLALILIALGI